MSNPLPQSIIEAYHSKRLIPLVGAGVSMAVRDKQGLRIFPSWVELLERGAAFIRAEGDTKIAVGIIAMIELAMYKEAADLMKRGLTGGLWDRFFRETFAIDVSLVNDNSLEIHRAISKLSNRIVTLNYDRLFRLALPSANVIDFDNTCESEIAEFCRNGLPNPSVWHLHGKIDCIKNLIITTDSYDRLYDEDKCSYAGAIQALRTLVQTNSLVFVGCSMSDAELLVELSRAHELFAGNVGPHYAIVKESESSAIKNKLKDLPVTLITFSEFGIPLIDCIESISESAPSPKLVAVTAKPDVRSNTAIRIAVLSAHPVSKTFDYEQTYRELKRLKCEVTYLPLTIEELNGLTAFDYIIILTHIIKNSVVIEDQAMSSELISLGQMCESIGCNAKGIILFSHIENRAALHQLHTEVVNAPLLVAPKLDKASSETYFFKLFRKETLPPTPDTIGFNLHKFVIDEIDDTHVSIKRGSSQSINIDTRVIHNYVGRKTDLENISRKIIEARGSSQILTIKGSGGIGKTTIVKKIAVELSARGKFIDGIHLVDCEAITKVAAFETIIAQAFYLERASDVRKQISESERRDGLLILDNVESLLHTDETKGLLDFIAFISDFLNVVATSREPLNFEFENIYELRQFTTDEAYELFSQSYETSRINSDDKTFVRLEILERLLDNNPLAIKLVTKNIPRGKNLRQLKVELENNIFDKAADVEINVFDSAADTNIERKKSLYGSILFSYRYLDEREQKAFELLSLFPDGINIEHFKSLTSSASGIKKSAGPQKSIQGNSNLITDRVLKSLENKSLVQINNNLIKLQSIVGRFAELRLCQRDDSDVRRYQINAFEFNYAFAQALSVLSRDNEKYHRFYVDYQANFLKSASCLHVISDKFKVIDYLDSLHRLATVTSSGRALNDVLANSPPIEFENEEERLALDGIKIANRYYMGDFDASFEDLKARIPLDYIGKIDTFGKINSLLIAAASDIYCMEGDALTVAELNIKRKSYPIGYPAALFHLGEFDENLARTAAPNFFTLETKFALGLLSGHEIDEYISTLYSKSNIDLVQCTYLKSKMSTIPKHSVKKLIAVNPYTEGLIDLMYAFTEKDQNKKRSLFETASQKLFHIKYYYVECQYFFAKFLFEIHDVKYFDIVYARANSLALSFNYRYQIHRLKSLRGASLEPYDPANYPLRSQSNFSAYIMELTRGRGSNGQVSPN